VWDAVERDWRTAPVSEQLRATLGFLEKLTLHPADVTHEDAETVRAASVSEDALVDAIHVCAFFSMIVRMADSLGWDVPPFEEFAARADGMLASGYALD
jgi:alkylhydroperoxidase family enzyme